MAETVEVSEAAQALWEHFGDQFFAGQDEGRRFIADALQERFGISEEEAQKLVEAGEREKAIRFVKDEVRAEAASDPAAGPTSAPIVGGHWEFGADRSSAASPKTG